MKPIIQPEKQKFFIVLVAALVSFLGLQTANQALLAYQIQSFFLISLYVYLFLVFLASFIFDMHLKKAGAWHALDELSKLSDLAWDHILVSHCPDVSQPV